MTDFHCSIFFDNSIAGFTKRNARIGTPLLVLFQALVSKPHLCGGVVSFTISSLFCSFNTHVHAGLYAGTESRASAEETLPATNTGCNRDHKRRTLGYKCNCAGGMGKGKKKNPLIFHCQF